MLCSFVTSSNHVVRFLETKEPKIQDLETSAKNQKSILKFPKLTHFFRRTTSLGFARISGWSINLKFLPSSNSGNFSTNLFLIFLTLSFPRSLPYYKLSSSLIDVGFLFIVTKLCFNFVGINSYLIQIF